MGFNPNEYKESTGGARKTLEAGQVFARIVDMRISQPAHVLAKEGMYIEVTLLGPDLPDFEGFKVDQNDPNAGVYPGQIANVRNGSFAFSTFTYNQKTIERDDQISQYLEDLTNQMGKLEALQVEYNRLAANHTQKNPKAPAFEIESIEDYFELVKSVVVDPDNWGLFAVVTEPYKNAEGYLRDSFYFPKKAAGKYPFVKAASADEQPASLLVPPTYVVEKAATAPKTATASAPGNSTPVQSFGGQQAQDDDNDLPF